MSATALPAMPRTIRTITMTRMSFLWDFLGLAVAGWDSWGSGWGSWGGVCGSTEVGWGSAWGAGGLVSVGVGCDSVLSIDTPYVYNIYYSASLV